MNTQYQNRSLLYTEKQIKALLKEDRKILVYGNTLLDVTDYKHPGGAALFDNNLGKDVKKLFDNQGHSRFAYSQLEELRIGYTSEQQLMEIDPELKKIYVALDQKIDIKQPIRPQIQQLSRQEYDEFLNRPLSVKTKVKYHPNPWIEKIFCNGDLKENALHETITIQHCVRHLYWFFLGLVFFTFTEYIVHRFQLHAKDLLPDNATKKQITKAFGRHQAHHAFINQPQFMPQTLPSMLIGYFVCKFLTKLLIAKYSATFSFAFVLGALIYDSIHMYAHFSGERKTWAWLDMLRDQHMRHHYRHKHKEFGVTNSFWDHVFDTTQ